MMIQFFNDIFPSRSGYTAVSAKYLVFHVRVGILGVEQNKKENRRVHTVKLRGERRDVVTLGDRA